MKSNFVKKTIVSALCIVLFAVAPFAVSAQTWKDDPALERQLQEALNERADLELLIKSLENYPDASAPQRQQLKQKLERLDQKVESLLKPEPEKRTARPRPYSQTGSRKTIALIEGVFDGQDSLIFEGNTIRLKHISYDEPTGVTVNGKPWEDLSKPFELGFPPDLAKATIVEEEGRGNVSLTVNPERLVLVVDDYKSGKASYRIRIGETDQTDRKLPEVQLFSDFLDKVEPGTVVITGDIDLGVFRFQSNTIQFRWSQRGEYPMNICVNGISWDLGKPFELDFTPDFEHAVITDTGERDDVIMSPHKESIDLAIGKYNGNHKITPTRVTISLDGKAYREIMSQEKKPAGKPKDYGPGVVVLEGSVDELRNMVFRGDKIYSKENKDKKKNQIASGIPADRFSVNGVEWEDFDTPFELGFVPDFASAKMVEKEGRGLIEFVAGKTEAELEIRDDGNRNGLYRVVLSLKKTDDGNQVADKPATTAPSGKTVSDGTSAGKTASAKQPEERFTVVLEGTLKGDGKFQFHSDTVEYWPQPLNANYYPSDVTVNGKPWETPDKGRTFFLDFVTDYMSGKIERVTGATRATWKVSPMLSQSILDPFDKSVGELFVTGNGQPFRIELSFANYRQDYVSRIVSMKDETREKNQIASLERAYAANKGQLSLTKRKAVEQYREEQRQERNLWLRDPDYTTDGKELPPVGWASTPVSRKPFPDQFDITIEATVNVVAKFAFQGNRIVYRDSTHPNDGKYPSQVKINGKPWKNLHLPFKLDNAIDQDSILGTEIETEFYRYTLHPEGEWTALTILNHGLRDEEPVKIKLTVLKSKKPYDDSVIYSGGVALPAEVITNPEAFENFWKNAMSGGNSGAGRSQAGQPAGQSGAAQPGAPAADNPGR